MKKKLFALLLCLVMVLTLASPVLATGTGVSENELTIQDVGHGEFKIVPKTLFSFLNSEIESISVTAVENVKGLYQTKSGMLLLQCTEESLLQVDEVVVPIDNLARVNSLIEEYGLSSMLAEDLRTMSARVLETGASAPKTILYTARASARANPTTQKEPRYYTYNGYKLKDDVFYTQYVTRFTDTPYSGRSTGTMLKNITDVGLYAVGTISQAGSLLARASLVGQGVSLAFGILQGWVNDFDESRLSPKDGDYSQFSIDYNSNTKYTGVESSPGNYPTCAKTGDVYVNRHGVHSFINNLSSTYWLTVNKYAYTPNYPNPAPKAIVSVGNPWIEEIEYRTAGGYVFCPNDV